MDPADASVSEVRLHMEPSPDEPHTQTRQHEQPRAIEHTDPAPTAGPPAHSENKAGQGADEDKVRDAAASHDAGKSADYFHSSADDKNASLVSSWKATTVVRQRNEGKRGCGTRLNARWKQSWLYEVTSTGHEDACAFECTTVPGPRGRYWPALYPPSALKSRPLLYVHRFYTFYVRPWFYMLAFLIISLYFFAVMNSIVTWRTNAQADRHGYLPVTPGIDDTVPAARQLPADKIFILSDLIHELIPAAAHTSYLMWKHFVDYSLAAMIIVVALIRIAQRDLMRLTEWASIEAMLFFIDGFLHVMTVYPDPWGSNGSCQSTGMRAGGGWVFTNLRFEYCGDQVRETHTCAQQEEAEEEADEGGGICGCIFER